MIHYGALIGCAPVLFNRWLILLFRVLALFLAQSATVQLTILGQCENQLQLRFDL